MASTITTTSAYTTSRDAIPAEHSRHGPVRFLGPNAVQIGKRRVQFS
jgi:hypothetical protein